jgi:thymidylate synthase
MTHDEYHYLNLLRSILQRGNRREDRTGTGTIGLFGQQIRFDLSSDTLPLLTTKFVPFKMVVKELLWFLKGQTDNKILQEQGVHIWEGNSTREFLDKRGLKDYREGDIGAMYGYQFRHFGAKYQGCDHDYTGQGIDQLEQVIDLLKNDPFSRRIAMTSYNVADLDKGVLHPCHGIFVQFYVDVIDGVKRLSCHMTQRSVDCGVGLPFNIASYAVLTHLIARKVDMLPRELIISTGDTHIYLNHVTALEQQLTREPHPFPKLRLGQVKDKKWEDLSVDDFELVGYVYHPSIKMVMNV